MAMSESLGFAIIGTGMIADFHAEAIRQVPGAKLIAAYSRSLDKTREFATRQGCRAALSIEELAGDPSILAACIATPRGSHADEAGPFLLAGRAVVGGKPL